MNLTLDPDGRIVAIEHERQLSDSEIRTALGRQGPLPGDVEKAMIRVENDAIVAAHLSGEPMTTWTLDRWRKKVDGWWAQAYEKARAASQPAAPVVDPTTLSELSRLEGIAQLALGEASPGSDEYRRADAGRNALLKARAAARVASQRTPGKASDGPPLPDYRLTLEDIGAIEDALTNLRRDIHDKAIPRVA